MASRSGGGVTAESGRDVVSGSGGGSGREAKRVCQLREVGWI